MADQRRLPSPGDIAEGRGGAHERGDGRYQVWHAADFTAMALSRIEREPYVHGYTHVADVQATGLAQAAEMTRHGETPWTANPGVQALAGDPRSTYYGDVIIDPAGRAYRVEDPGFSEVQAAGRWPSPGEIAAEGRGGPDPPGPERGGGQDEGIKATGPHYIIVPYGDDGRTDEPAPGDAEYAHSFRVFVLTRQMMEELGDFPTIAEAQEMVKLNTGGKTEGQLFEAESYYDLPGFGRWPDVRSLRVEMPPADKGRRPSPGEIAAEDRGGVAVPEQAVGKDRGKGRER